MIHQAENTEPKSLICPRCHTTIQLKEARKRWVLGSKPIICGQCATECIPEDFQRPFRLSKSNLVLLAAIFILNYFLMGFFSQRFDTLVSFLFSMMILVPIAIGFRWFNIRNIKIVTRIEPQDTDAVPENLSPLITENDDGTYSVKERNFKDWKSAEAYLDLLERTQKTSR